jgi:ubiquinone/menaquinone biosynthesis C-methylase UbiE
LDAGCGSGYPVAQILAQFFEVNGVDFADEQIRLASGNLPDSTFVNADISKMPFKKDVFDVLCSLCNHPRAPPRTLEDDDRLP